jgi:hypothetical protein
LLAALDVLPDLLHALTVREARGTGAVDVDTLGRVMKHDDPLLLLVK